jgi:hypothetical protein
MGKYDPDSWWGLTNNYNTRRGEVLDGTRLSEILSVNWRAGKHSLEDGSIHHRIMQYLETQPGKRATCINISNAVPTSYITEHSLRELEKQQICGPV